MLINEKCGNSKEVVHGGQLTGNIKQQKKPCVLPAISREYFFNKHLEYRKSVGKYDFSFRSVNNLKEIQLFPDQTNRDHFDRDILLGVTGIVSP